MRIVTIELTRITVEGEGHLYRKSVFKIVDLVGDEKDTDFSDAAKQAFVYQSGRQSVGGFTSSDLLVKQSKES